MIQRIRVNSLAATPVLLSTQATFKPVGLVLIRKSDLAFHPVQAQRDNINSRQEGR